MLKVLNPFIWVINVFMYFAYLDTKHGSYDFSKDIKYF